VNGAQTVGSIAANLKKKESVARVPIRLISLESAPDGFAAMVTRSNNTQNRIDARNFVALDPQQERLRGEFAVDGIAYEYRQGEIESSGPNKTGLVEATLALACTHEDIDLATQAKREIGKLWEDITRPPYKSLFRSGITSDYIWSRIVAFRRIEEALQYEQLIRSEKSAQIVTHGNRLIASLAFRTLLRKIDNVARISDVDKNVIDEMVSDISSRVYELVERDYSQAYLAVLFKNRAKCGEIAERILDYS
jgi:hypothetical protein